MPSALWYGQCMSWKNKDLQRRRGDIKIKAAYMAKDRREKCLATAARANWWKWGSPAQGWWRELVWHLASPSPLREGRENGEPNVHGQAALQDLLPYLHHQPIMHHLLAGALPRHLAIQGAADSTDHSNYVLSGCCVVCHGTGGAAHPSPATTSLFRLTVARE